MGGEQSVFRIICFWPVNNGRVSHASSPPRLVTPLIALPCPTLCLASLHDVVDVEWIGRDVSVWLGDHGPVRRQGWANNGRNASVIRSNISPHKQGERGQRGQHNVQLPVAPLNPDPPERDMLSSCEVRARTLECDPFNHPSRVVQPGGTLYIPS